MDKKSREYEICACKHVTRGVVEDLVREKKILNLKELCEVANIGNVCGGCREDLDNLITEIEAEMEACNS